MTAASPLAHRLPSGRALHNPTLTYPRTHVHPPDCPACISCRFLVLRHLNAQQDDGWRAIVALGRASKFWRRCARTFEFPTTRTPTLEVGGGWRVYWCSCKQGERHAGHSDSWGNARGSGYPLARTFDRRRLGTVQSSRANGRRWIALSAAVDLAHTPTRARAPALSGWLLAQDMHR